MNFTNFRFETDADGIALVTWDMPGRSMNVLTPEVIAELGAIVDKIAATPRSRAPSSPPARRASPAAPTSPCCKSMGGEYARLAKAEGEEAAMRVFVDRAAQLIARLSPARDLRQAVRRRDQRRVHGRRLRTDARLPLPHRRRQRQGARRPAGDQGRPVPRRRRHAARRAADADAATPCRCCSRASRSARPPPRRWASCTRSRRSARSCSAPRIG